MGNRDKVESSQTEKNITRRNILKTSLITAASLAAVPSLSYALSKKKILRVAVPERLQGDSNLLRLASTLKKICGLDLVISDSQGSTPLEALSVGTAQMAYTSPCFEETLPDHFFFFSGIPFGMNSIELLSWLKQDEGNKLLEESFSEMGLKAWVIRIRGASTGAWHKTPLTKPDDYKNKRIISHGLAKKVFKNLGANITDLPPEKSKSLFEKNEIDAIEGISPAESLEYGLERLDAIYYWPGWHTPCESFFLVMKKKEFETLPEKIRSGLDWLSYSSISSSMSSFTYQNSLKTSILTAIPKLNMKRIPDNVLMEMARESLEVIEAIGKTASRSKLIYDSYTKFFKEATSWTQLGDEAFSLARSLTLSYLETKNKE